jgi:hypothetical protein
VNIYPGNTRYVRIMMCRWLHYTFSACLFLLFSGTFAIAEKDKSSAKDWPSFSKGVQVPAQYQLPKCSWCPICCPFSDKEREPSAKEKIKSPGESPDSEKEIKPGEQRKEN